MNASCASSAPPGRPTHASNARADDPWLEGERCTAETREDPGLRIEEVDPGTGLPVTDGATVRVHYDAKTTSGALLHDTRPAGFPIEIIVGSTHTICGFERALIGMRAGGQRRVTVPSRLAFGEAGHSTDVPPRTDIVFTIDLYLPADVVIERGGGPVKPAPAGGGGRRR